MIKKQGRIFYSVNTPVQKKSFIGDSNNDILEIPACSVILSKKRKYISAEEQQNKWHHMDLCHTLMKTAAFTP